MKKKILVCSSYTLKAPLVLIDTAADSPLFSLFGPSGHCLLSATFPLSSQEWREMVTHFIEFLFPHDESVLIPDGFNNIPASLPLPFFKPPLNLGDGTG